MFRSVLTGCLSGVDANIIHTEVDVSTGLPGFSMVGSLSNEVKEAKERVQVALKNTDFDLPPNKITINLSPADIRKDGTCFDLPIAVGLLGCFGLFEEDRLRGTVFLGELGLNGELKAVNGVLPIVKAAAKLGVEECIVPNGNLAEGSVIPGITVRGAEHIKQVLKFLQEDEERKDELLPPGKCRLEEYLQKAEQECFLDFAEVKGQKLAKRAAEIAAAGFHNLALSGPPGAGKSMIAKRIPGILPKLSVRESLDVSAIYSVAGLLSEDMPIVTTRPFQSPHHTISGAALVGGGGKVRPGAISLAHKGVLFLDELTEFPRSILENLRQPMEDKKVNIVRVHGSYVFPSDFMLVCAMNPSKCGFYPDMNKCTCTEAELHRYRGKLSGPLIDRIDMHVETQRVDLSSLSDAEVGESTAVIRERVSAARELQEKRFGGQHIQFNSQMEVQDIEKYCRLEGKEKKLMELAYNSLELSARTYHRVLKVARTIADLEGEERILERHISEALAYRFMRG
ncbi:MAG: YifB family Mg chelatase-like AAA ATPase [Lachnospiraceae bacterium]|nr:YifB family Mg chelatase-like AAA ATPase [Lachnospiraceae bacterium]